MDRNSKIYVAGHKGLVGSAILRKLKAEGYTNLITRTHSELDLTRQADVETFFESVKPEYVFLAAAKVGGILANMTYPAEFIYENTAIALNVIHAAYKYETKKLLNLGSSCIYPKNAPQPMKEDYLLTGNLEPTNEAYAIAKIAAIKLCKYYNEQYATNFISAMPTNLYGPNDNFDLQTSHVLPALIRKFHLAKLSMQGDLEGIKRDEQTYGPIPDDILISLGLTRSTNLSAKASATADQQITNNSSPRSSFTSNQHELTNQRINQLSRGEANGEPRVLLWGSGTPFREFLHVDDLAAATVFLIENCNHKDIGEFVNLGTGAEYNIKEYADIVAETVGFEGEIGWDKSKPDGTLRKLLDVGRIKTLGWQSKINLRDGIAFTYEWYVKNSKLPFAH